MDRLLSMEVFVASVDLGSFTAAANVFKITPAMVSKHIVSLEKRLGATLLARTTRTQKLTEIGQKYYDNCKRILGQIADAEAGAEAMGSKPKGHLRVNASMWFGSLTLAPIICDYLKQFPEVNIELSLTDRYVDIVDEGFDVAIRIGKLKDSSLVARKLSIFELAVCASPDYIAKAGMPKTPEDLTRHQCLGFTNWHNQGGWKLMQRQLGLKTAQAPRFESDNGQALLAAAVKGIGIIMMPKELLRPDIEAGRLIELMKKHVPPARPIHAIYPKERQLAPKLTSFVDFLVEKLRR
jgi:DNA-binding transcriptional LysR family regulator